MALTSETLMGPTDERYLEDDNVLTTHSQKAMLISTKFPAKWLTRVSRGPESTSKWGQFAVKNWQKI
jgi:hypothetical protein